MNAPILRLTALAHGGGCGCKLAPSVLQQLLAGQPQAGALRQSAGRHGDRRRRGGLAARRRDHASSPPPTSSCRWSTIRAISAASPPTNALSDVYAMGGKPIMALAILGMPLDKLPIEHGPRNPRRRRVDLRGGRNSRSRAAIRSIRPSRSTASPSIGLCRARGHPAQLRRAPRRRADPDQGDRRRRLFGRVQEARALRRRPMREMMASTTLLNRVGADARAGRGRARDDRRDRLRPSRPRARNGARRRRHASTCATTQCRFWRRREALAAAGFVTGASGRNWASYGDAVVLPSDVRRLAARCC